MNIGFYEGTLNERGVAVAVYDYADYNEKILKNNSFIITKKNKKTLTKKVSYLHLQINEYLSLISII